MDVTERKRAEEERERLSQLEADLAHMNRVSMMGELAASLAHEIKQPIAAAAVRRPAPAANWLSRDATQSDGSLEGRLGNGRGRDARQPHHRPRSARSTGEARRSGKSVDLNEIVREMSVLLSDTANRNAVSIRTELDPELPTTTADRVQLQQVLMNLMLNGIEAMQERARRTDRRIEEDRGWSTIGFGERHGHRAFDR